MNLHEWLDQAGTTVRAKDVAERLNVSKAAVSLWRDYGVPMKHMAAIESLSGGQVKTLDMLKHALHCREVNRAKLHAKRAAEAVPVEAA